MVTRNTRNEAKSRELTQRDVREAVGALNDLALGLASAGKAVQRLQGQLNKLIKRLPPGPGTPTPNP